MGTYGAGVETSDAREGGEGRTCPCARETSTGGEQEDMEQRDHAWMRGSNGRLHACVYDTSCHHVTHNITSCDMSPPQMEVKLASYEGIISRLNADIEQRVKDRVVHESAWEKERQTMQAYVA